MHLKPLLPAGLVCCLVLAASIPARAEDAGVAAARKIFAEWQDTVVGVSAVAKISFLAEGSRDAPMNIPDREQKMETLGTLIDPSGIVVAALSTLDPSREFSTRDIRGPSGPIKLEANATLKEVRLVMPDGTDIPAEIVMKDADLDLAFLKVRTTSKEAQGVVFKAVDLQHSTSVKVTEDIVSLSRMDELLNRQPAVIRGQVLALTKKPREFVRVSGATLGCPTFALDGKLVGVAVSRSMKGKSALTVLIPAADVLEIAEQARNTKPVSSDKAAPRE